MKFYVYTEDNTLWAQESDTCFLHPARKERHWYFWSRWKLGTYRAVFNPNVFKPITEPMAERMEHARKVREELENGLD